MDTRSACTGSKPTYGRFHHSDDHGRRSVSRPPPAADPRAEWGRKPDDCDGDVRRGLLVAVDGATAADCGPLGPSWPPLRGVESPPLGNLGPGASGVRPGHRGPL